MNQIIITPLKNAKLLATAKLLPQQGILRLSHEKLLYLDIDDRFINELHPLIGETEVEKPDYFSIGMGAHISIIYPNEGKEIAFIENQAFKFQVENFFKAQTPHAIYFAISVFSSDLINIRRTHCLEDKLNFKGFGVPMHITIGKVKLT